MLVAGGVPAYTYCMNQQTNPAITFRIATVPYLNAEPLIFGLEQRPDVELIAAPPAHLADMLTTGRVDAALIPSIDFYPHREEWQMLPCGAIGSSGEVLTVRVFSQNPPETIDILAGDVESHTSIMLSRIIWRHRFGLNLTITPLRDQPTRHPAILLIGDKVFPQLGRWPHELDLGGVWRELTGLPFVFAFWAARSGVDTTAITKLLDTAIHDGLANLSLIAQTKGPLHGFPPAKALRYFQQNMCYDLGPQQHEALNRFYTLAAELKRTLV